MKKLLFSVLIATFICMTNANPVNDSTSDQEIKTIKVVAKTIVILACILVWGVDSVVEGSNIMYMGSTSAESIKRAAVASATINGIKSFSSSEVLSFLSDAYFLLKDKEKIEHSKALATFHKQHKKYALTLKNKRLSQAALLTASTLVKIGSVAFMTNAVVDSFGGNEKIPKAELCIGGLTILLCTITDFFRKHARYNAELSEKFEEWRLNNKKAC